MGDPHRLAEVRKDPLPSQTTHGVLAHRAERIAFDRAAVLDRRERVDVAGRIGDDAAVRGISRRSGPASRRFWPRWTPLARSSRTSWRPDRGRWGLRAERPTARNRATRNGWCRCLATWSCPSNAGVEKRATPIMRRRTPAASLARRAIRARLGPILPPTPMSKWACASTSIVVSAAQGVNGPDPTHTSCVITGKPPFRSQCTQRGK